MAKAAKALHGHSQVSVALDWLCDATAKKNLEMYRTGMIKPLVSAVLKAESTGNDKADLRALRDGLPDVFDKMDGGGMEDVATTALTHAALTGMAVALPARMPVTVDGEK